MGRITLQQAAQWCGGHIDPKYKDVTFFGANNDTRTMQKGELFVALQGNRDGHDFIPKALEQGAAAVLCTHCDGDYPAIVVEDTRIALGLIAKHERQRLGIKVVAITGSVGKSTTKEMIAAVLSGAYQVAKSPANHNNDIGMPMAILAIPEDAQIAVLEMGMNHFREIAYLTNIAKPDLAVIINIGTMHIEHLGSVEGILKAKLEILEGMEDNRCVVINGDDALLWNQTKTDRYRAVYFGSQNTQCGVFARDLREQEGVTSFQVTAQDKTFDIQLYMEGMHFVSDALAAICVALELGVPVEQIQTALRHFQNMAGRQEIFQKNGYTIIKDCYNAGPESMEAALNVLGNRPGRHVAVLGEMLELGVCAWAEHYRIGRIAAEKADIVLAYGPNSERVLSGAYTGGMASTAAMAFTDQQRMIQTLKSIAKPGDVLLFKGSRGMKMETVLEGFLQEEK